QGISGARHRDLESARIAHQRGPRASARIALRVQRAKKKAARERAASCNELAKGSLFLQIELDLDVDVLADVARIVPTLADVEVEAVDFHLADELRRVRFLAGREREVQRDRKRRA